MANENWLNCVVCGKKDRIMKRCGNCQSIFYCSIECQKFDWVKHKANCCFIKTHSSVDGGDIPEAVGQGEALDTILQSTGTKCKILDCENKLQRLEVNKNEWQNFVHTNIEHVGKNCHASSSQIDRDLTEKIPSQGVKDLTSIERPRTVKQPTETVHELTKRKENEKPLADVEKQKILGSCKIEKLSHLATNPKDDISTVDVYVKYAKGKYKVEIELPCTGLQALKYFSRVLHVPLERLKLIHRGKLQTESTIVDKLKPNSVFLAFGEMAESEDGLEPDDIELIMKQLSVERNVAIKALRKTNCLIDAIFEIGNDI